MKGRGFASPFLFLLSETFYNKSINIKIFWYLYLSEFPHLLNLSSYDIRRKNVTKFVCSFYFFSKSWEQPELEFVISTFFIIFLFSCRAKIDILLFLFRRITILFLLFERKKLFPRRRRIFLPLLLLGRTGIFLFQRTGIFQIILKISNSLIIWFRYILNCGSVIILFHMIQITICQKIISVTFDPVLESSYKRRKALLSQKRCKFSPSQPVANNMFTFFIFFWGYSVASAPF